MVKRRATDANRALALAKLTDQRFLDPLLGFVLPGLGDAMGAVAGFYIVFLARRHDLPVAVQAQMVANIAIDCLGGLVPVVGDVFDLLNRANLRNARLLERHLLPERSSALPSAERAGLLSRPFVAGALLVAALAATGAVITFALTRLLR